MPEIIVYSAFQAIVLLDMLPKKRFISPFYLTCFVTSSKFYYIFKSVSITSFQEGTTLKSN